MPATHASWRSWKVSAGLFIDLGDGQGDREFPIVQLNMTFALNAVPTATVTIACGRELHTGAVSPIHQFASSLLQQRRAWIYVVLDEGGRGGDIPDIGLPMGTFGEIVFSGLTSGVGFQKSLQNGQVGYTLHLVHALAGLTFSSALSDSSHPSNPSQYSWGALAPVQSASGEGDVTGIASALTHFTEASVATDFWGEASYPWLTEMTEEDGIQIDELPLIGSGGNDGAALALKLLDTAPAEYIPLMLVDTSIDSDVADNIVSDVSLITQYPDRIAASTMWDIINGLAADYLFAVVPTCTRGLVVPFVPGYRQVHKTLSADTYAFVSLSGESVRPLRAVGVLSSIQMQCTSDGTDANTPEFRAMGVGGWAENRETGQILIRPSPRWMSQCMATTRYSRQAAAGREAAGSGVAVVSNSIQPGAGEAPAKTSADVPERVDKMKKGILRRYADYLFAAESVRTRQGQLSGPLRFDIAPGSSIKVEGTNGAFLAEDQLGLPFYATVLQVTIALDSEACQVGTSYHVGYLRSEAENALDATSIAEHPLYADTFKGCSLLLTEPTP